MPDTTSTIQPIAWRPDRDMLENSNITRFMRKHGIETLEQLLAMAAGNPDWFWDAVVRDLDLRWIKPYKKVLDDSKGIKWSKWFVDGKINISANCLEANLDRGRGIVPALIWEGEDGEVQRFTYEEIFNEVNALANGLKQIGVCKGDRVGIFMPMIPETVIACLAIMHLGAIFIPIFSGYGPEAVATRLADCQARFLFTADGFWRRGRQVLIKPLVDEAASSLPSLEKIVMVSRLNANVPWVEGRDVRWSSLIDGGIGKCPLELTGAEDPFMIIYTSGTTGRPKGTVHVHCGFPIKAAQDISHCFDLKEGEIFFWLSDMGWMMGPWSFLGTFILGGTLFLYEGAQDYPAPDRLWELVERHGINILGLSPTSIRSLMPLGEEWVRMHDLSSLRILGSTGEAWNPDPWWWFFKNVGGGHCPIINYSGGTEISGGILGCFPITPLKPCSFAGPIPGMVAEVLGETGEPVREIVGELALKAPWPGITRGFWGAPERYEETYWSRWPGVWVHGDLAYIDEDGFWYILGRSDDTIKIAGKRVGPAEVESALVNHPAVKEAAAIGVPHEVKGEALVCFVVLNPGYKTGETLHEELNALVVQHLGKSLQPDRINYVTDLPKTRNAKILRRVIRARYMGEDPGDLSSLENPLALEEMDKAL